MKVNAFHHNSCALGFICLEQAIFFMFLDTYSCLLMEKNHDLNYMGHSGFALLFFFFLK